MNKRCQYANLFFSHSRFFFALSFVKFAKRAICINSLSMKKKTASGKNEIKNHVGRARDISETSRIYAQHFVAISLSLIDDDC